MKRETIQLPFKQQFQDQNSAAFRAEIDKVLDLVSRIEKSNKVMQKPKSEGQI